MTSIHIVGAGLAGLSAAVRLVRLGHQVAIYEASPQAGGRCRSYFDNELDCRLDNGNHLILSGNNCALKYAREIGSLDSFATPEAAIFPFIDVRTQRRWEIKLNNGFIPTWLFNENSRIPNTLVGDYLLALRLLFMNKNATVESLFPKQTPLFETFWEPLTVAVVNTPTPIASAKLLRAAMLRTFALGGRYCVPYVAKEGLSESLIDPALRILAEHGVDIQYGMRLKNIEFQDGHVTGLEFAGQKIALNKSEQVILAVPHYAAAALLPDLQIPTQSHPIINCHFRLSWPVPHDRRLPFMGLIGGTAHWMFARNDIASTTISAADHLMDLDEPELVGRIWKDVAIALEMPINAVPKYKLVKEKRATFSQTPENELKRPGPITAFDNLLLAGDWTATGLPATIESAIRSGWAAAKLAGSV